MVSSLQIKFKNAIYLHSDGWSPRLECLFQKWSRLLKLHFSAYLNKTKNSKLRLNDDYMTDLTDKWLLTDILLTDCWLNNDWLINDWLLTDCWLAVDWQLTIIKIERWKSSILPIAFNYLWWLMVILFLFVDWSDSWFGSPCHSVYLCHLQSFLTIHHWGGYFTWQ